MRSACCVWSHMIGGPRHKTKDYHQQQLGIRRAKRGRSLQGKLAMTSVVNVHRKSICDACPKLQRLADGSSKMLWPIFGPLLTPTGL